MRSGRGVHLAFDGRVVVEVLAASHRHQGLVIDAAIEQGGIKCLERQASHALGKAGRKPGKVAEIDHVPLDQGDEGVDGDRDASFGFGGDSGAGAVSTAVSSVGFGGVAARVSAGLVSRGLGRGA